MADSVDDMVFADDVVEKVERLAGVLESIGEHPRLRVNLALHGGTALNLFLLEPERLSLDLHLNYIASEDREEPLDAAIPVLAEFARPADAAEEEFAAGLAAGTEPAFAEGAASVAAVARRGRCEKPFFL